MWVCLNNAFVSIVKHRTKDGLLVRARSYLDLKRFLSPLNDPPEIDTTPNADYLVRCLLSSVELEQVLAEHVRTIDYDNFKNSVREEDRRGVYNEIWYSARALDPRN